MPGSRLGPAQPGPSRHGDEGRRPGQIRAGRHGLSREQVAASQRARLLASMTELACRRGYQKVRVGDLVQHAGISRRTFYELYEGKEECLIAAYDQALEGLLAPTLAAFEAGGAWLDRLRRALDALLGALAADPLAARLCFVEVFAAGPLAVAKRNQGMAALDRLFEGPTGAGVQPASVATGRVGDLAEILSREIAAGRTERLPGLRAELMYTLVLPYLGPEAAARELERPAGAAGLGRALPAGAPAHGDVAGEISDAPLGHAPPAGSAPTLGGAQPPRPSNGNGNVAAAAIGRPTTPPLWGRTSVNLARGHHDLSRDEVQAVQRERLLRALVAEVAEHGYHDTTIRALATRAGVSARSVYELFEGKEDCFLGAYAEIAGYLLGAAADAMEAAGPAPRERLGALTEMLLGFCAREPDMARVAIVEVLIAGPAARARREQAMRQLAALVEEPLRELLHPEASSAPVAARALVGGVHELIYDAVDRRDVGALPDPETVFAAAQGAPLIAV